MCLTSSVYVHVPFCHRKCYYCDFYSIGTGVVPNNFATLVSQEIRFRKNFLPSSSIATLYFGGGTPSLLPVEQLELIICSLGKNFSLVELPEITIEVNPDDITPELLKQYRAIGINRISMGVQSFNDDELHMIGRRHDAQRAIESVAEMKQAGFGNISIDLIYGLPGSTLKTWENSLLKAMEMDVQHLSCYHLTIEERTVMYQKIKRGELQPVTEDMSVAQFNLLRQITQANGFEHYEVSNFARLGFESRHNSGYWKQQPYLGLGPAAHSYSGKCRQWNPSSIKIWQAGIDAGRPAIEEEQIDEKTAFNELIMTSMRTKWGISLDLVSTKFPQYMAHLEHQMQKYLPKQFLEIPPNNHLRIPSAHYFTSDGIIVDLMVE